MVAEREKTSVDWFYGFKLHLAINHRGELLNLALTTGNIDDHIPVGKLLEEQIEHSRHRSPANFVVSLLAGLIAYCHRPKKPSIAFANFVLTQSA